MTSAPTEAENVRIAGQGGMSGPSGGTVSASREPPEGGTTNVFIVLFGIGHCTPIAVAVRSAALVKRVLESGKFIREV